MRISRLARWRKSTKSSHPLKVIEAELKFLYLVWGMMVAGLLYLLVFDFDWWGVGTLAYASVFYYVLIRKIKKQRTRVVLSALKGK